LSAPVSLALSLLAQTRRESTECPPYPRVAALSKALGLEGSTSSNASSSPSSSSSSVSPADKKSRGLLLSRTSGGGGDDDDDDDDDGAGGRPIRQTEQSRL